MTNHELEIIMKLKDEVSKRLQGVQGNLLRFSNQVKELGQAMKHVGREISQVGRTLTLFGGIITGPLMLAFRTADKYSAGVHQQLEKLKNLSTAFQVQLASAMVPVVEKFINVLGRLWNIWNALSPLQQQMIVQGTLLAGVFLTVGGGVAFLIGKFVSLAGIITTVVANFLSFIAVNPVLALIIGSLVVLIGLMIRFKNVADAVLNGVEISLLLLANGFETIKITIVSGLAFIMGGLEKVYMWLAKIPGNIGRNFDIAAQNIQNAREELDKFSTEGLSNVEKNVERIKEILASGEGSLSEGFEALKEKIKNVWDLLKNPPEFNIKPLQERFASLKEIADDMFRAMERSLSDFFYNAVTEKGVKLIDFFRNLGQSILHIWTDMLAKMITRWIESMTTMQRAGSSGGGWMNILSSVLGIFSAGTSIGSVTGGVGGTNTGIQNTPMGPAPTWSPFHRGGPIRAHNGLAVDEVPVIAQTGEYVLSRKDVRGLGGFTGIDSLVRGGQSIAIQPTIVIQAVDAKTGVDYLLRNKDTIGKIVSEQILKDMALRRINQRYA